MRQSNTASFNEYANQQNCFYGLVSDAQAARERERVRVCVCLCTCVCVIRFSYISGTCSTTPAHASENSLDRTRKRRGPEREKERGKVRTLVRSARMICIAK